MAMATAKIMRRSIHIFFQHYHYFTTTVALLLLPVSASILLSHVVESTSLSMQSTIEDRAQSIIYGAGLSPSNQFFSFLGHKLSRAIYSSVMTLPFTLSFLLVAKAAIFQTLHQNPRLPSIFSSSSSHYKALLLTQLCNTFLVFSGTATGLCILFFALNSLVDDFGFSSKLLIFLSAAGIVLYSIILSNTLVVCNLASVVAGTENCSGFLAILKACVLIKGQASTALSLALPVNFGLVSLEALFQHPVVRASSSNKLSIPTAFEGLLIAYLYSLVILIDTIMTCTFYKSCETGY